MVLPTDINIENLTYTHDELRDSWFHLDRLLDRMAPIFSIKDPLPLVRELGTLIVLPSEILLDILEYISLVDLMRFRRCNRYASYFVGTIPSLRTVLRIAPNTVKGLMALQVSTHITARQLCRKLYQRECDACGRLAQCIYLITCLRACLSCLHPDHRVYFHYPRTEDELVETYLLRPEQLATRPSYRHLRGTFTNGMNKFKFEERHTMYDCPSDCLNEKLGWSPWYDERAKYELDPDLSALTRQRYIRGASMGKQDPKREAITVVRDPLPARLLVHMAVVLADWPNSTGSKGEQGVFCSSCMGTVRETALYTKDAFLEHLGDCRVQPEQYYIRNSRYSELWLCEDDD